MDPRGAGGAPAPAVQVPALPPPRPELGPAAGAPGVSTPSSAVRPQGRSGEEDLPAYVGARLLVEDHGGNTVQETELGLGVVRLGRTEGDVLFPEDQHMAPLHAWIHLEPEGAWLRDPGTANGIYLHQLGEHLLRDGDAFVAGSQLLLYRDCWSLRAAGNDGTQLFGSAGWRTPHRLVNLRRGGDVVFVHTLQGDLVIGREGASPYHHDRFLARRHVAVDLTADGVRLRDLSGGRGYFLRMRTDTWLQDGQRFLVGSRVLRVRMRLGDVEH